VEGEISDCQTQPQVQSATAWQHTSGLLRRYAFSRLPPENTNLPAANKYGHLRYVYLAGRLLTGVSRRFGGMQITPDGEMIAKLG
jgi:hypothetical protein